MQNMKLWMVVSIILLTTILNGAERRYEIKSGIIEYKIHNSSNMMGVKTSGEGSAVTSFKEWGNIELHSEQSEMVTMGQKMLDRHMTKVENGKVFVVDFDQKTIYEYTPSMLASSEHKELAKKGKEMLESMGGKKVGQEKFMGYMCEVWEMMHIKVWLHKGVMLKSDTDMMGMKHTITATKINFNTSVSQSDLTLPDYPIKKGDEMMIPGQDSHEKEMPQITPEQMQQMQEMMKNFSQR